MKRFLLGLLVGGMIGVVGGYGWRMTQIEPIRDREVEMLKKEFRVVLGEATAYKTLCKKLGVRVAELMRKLKEREEARLYEESFQNEDNL